jgi:hypothetical protein
MKTKPRKPVASPENPVPRGGLVLAVRDLAAESPQHLAAAGLSRADADAVIQFAADETARNPVARGTEATLADGRKVSVTVQYPPAKKG